MHNVRLWIAFFAALVLHWTPSFAASPADPQSATICRWGNVEYAHISSYNQINAGRIDIKTSVQGSCSANFDAVLVTAQMFLEVQVSEGVWATYIAGQPITKNIQGVDQVWQRGELFAVGPCLPGTYRGRLTRSFMLEGVGIIISLGADQVSAGRDIDCKPTKVSMVIDDTGSMSTEIGGIRSALSTLINSQPEDEYTRWSLTTFKDSPTFVGSTENRAQVLSWVSALTASGGGDCPEDALGGVTNGLNALGTDSASRRQMFVATDASTQNGDINSIIATARANGVAVNVLLTGDCGMSAGRASESSAQSSQVVLKRLAYETGGLYFYIPSKNPQQINAALTNIFAKIENSNPADVNASGTVDCDDVAIIRSTLTLRTGQPGFDPRADVNRDGVIDVRDLAIVARLLPPGSACR